MEEPTQYGVAYIAEKPNDTQDNVSRFKQILSEMASIYERKNADYGNSTSATYQRYGAVSYLTRMLDKFNRIERLAQGANAQVTDERLIDTLTDLANYCIIFRMEIENETTQREEN
jgi:hypothetical protein